MRKRKVLGKWILVDRRTSYCVAFDLHEQFVYTSNRGRAIVFDNIKQARDTVLAICRMHRERTEKACLSIVKV